MRPDRRGSAGFMWILFGALVPGGLGGCWLVMGIFLSLDIALSLLLGRYFVFK